MVKRDGGGEGKGEKRKGRPVTRFEGRATSTEASGYLRGFLADIRIKKMRCRRVRNVSKFAISKFVKNDKRLNRSMIT